MANAAKLKLVSVNSIEDHIGRTDYDFFDKSLVDLYISEDQKVLAGDL
jgi:hypothetical protein